MLPLWQNLYPIEIIVLPIDMASNVIRKYPDEPEKIRAVIKYLETYLENECKGE